MRLKKYTGVSWKEKKKLAYILTLEFNTFSEAAMNFCKAFLFFFFFFKELMDYLLLIYLAWGKK